MNNKVSFSFETEISIRQAYSSITMRNKAELLLKLWNRNLIPDDVFVKYMKYETGIPIELNKKETQ